MESPLNDVDSLILSQFCYLKFDGIVPGINEGGQCITLEEIAVHPQVERLFSDTRFEKNNRALFERMVKSRRYRHMGLHCYVNLVEKEWEAQFSAISFLLEDNTVYVAFRGTDETIIGWKEDFNMAFLTTVPGHTMSVKYLNDVATNLKRPFYIGGHSKGGNLAIYSAMCCKDSIQEHIRKVYNMDGPGFHQEVLENCHYDRIAQRVEKFLPKSSIVGMLLERNTDYHVVESRGRGIGQHDPFTWVVKNCELVEAKEVSGSQKLMDESINDWVLSLNEEQMRAFIDTLYQVVSASEAEDLITFAADIKKSMQAVMGAMKEVDEDTKKTIKEVIKSLVDITYQKTRKEALGTFQRITGKNNAKSESRKELSAQSKDAPDATEPQE